MNKISLHPLTLPCYILDTGYWLAWEHHLIAGGKRRKVACHSLVALLRHPDHGWLLWDSGYAPPERGRILFAADGALLRQAIYEDRLPSRLTNFFVDDARAVGSTLHRLHDFSLTHRDVILVPSHCPETFAQEVGGRHEAI